jgi:hypothetical protein
MQPALNAAKAKHNRRSTLHLKFDFGTIFADVLPSFPGADRMVVSYKQKKAEAICYVDQACL